MSSRVMIAPSILSADFSYLRKDMRTVEKAGADWLHIDVMDGHFVPNMTIGPVVVKALRKYSRLFFDVHLMIERPDKYWENFASAGAGLITFHAETRLDHRQLIQKMKHAGIKTGISLRPCSSIGRAMALLPYVDLILVMTVEPGFGGQKFMPEMLPRINAFREKINSYKFKCDLQVDGGINQRTAVESVKAGANVLVAGNSIFGEHDPASAIKKLRRSADISTI